VDYSGEREAALGGGVPGGIIGGWQRVVWGGTVDAFSVRGVHWGRNDVFAWGRQWSSSAQYWELFTTSSIIVLIVESFIMLRSAKILPEIQFCVEASTVIFARDLQTHGVSERRGRRFQ